MSEEIKYSNTNCFSFALTNGVYNFYDIFFEENIMGMLAHNTQYDGHRRF